MSESGFYGDIVNQISKRSVEATISMLGITNAELRKHLANEMGQGKDKLGFLGDPVFEAMFPWEQSDTTMEQLSGHLLFPSLIKAMDSAGHYKFGKNWFPFKHQIKAWNTLLGKDKKSVIVTSGTGSGKTECFMVPILNDLAREYEQSSQSLIGVRALFIYPLNALINSQRERLRSWTQAYDDGIRFCLYNGNTEENKHHEQGKYPNEILTRKNLRETPSPVLVTNATMLEYMLVRQIDEPILEQSQGKLRWIVLDEAHTYIGSQAAELSLLLRRVMHAFGVKAKDVRFIATSATIGDPEADKQLQEYLANISGVDVDQIVVVGGKRSVPEIISSQTEQIPIQDIMNLDRGERYSIERYEALAANQHSKKLRALLTEQSIPARLSNLSKEIFSDEERLDETLSLIDVCSNTSKPGPLKSKQDQDATPFLPLRGHLFHQVLSGLWGCVNKNCDAKKETPLAQNWPFGKVYVQRKDHCDCGSPIFELAFCNECNTPHLIANESSGRLLQVDRDAIDEFSLDFEDFDDADVDSDNEEPVYSNKTVIAPLAADNNYPLSIDKERNIVSQGMESIDIFQVSSGEMYCCSCEHSGFKSDFYRRSLLGTPFYISNTVPLLLDVCQESDEPNDRPNRGRRLITFTDSRQGTARISTKIQQDSERDTIRGQIYRECADNVSSISEDDLTEKKNKLEKLNASIEKLKSLGMDEDAAPLEEVRDDLLAQLDSSGAIQNLTWISAVNKLHASSDISTWIFDYYRELNPLLFPQEGGARVLTETLLLREFARRPKRQNSMETLGLVSVQYPALNEIKKTPPEWDQLKLSLDDWKAFLKVCLDFFVRENSIIDIPEDWVNWMGARIYPKSVINPLSDERQTSRIKKWPQVTGARSNRLIRMLALECNLTLDYDAHVDILNAIMRAAWDALTAKYQIVDKETNTSKTHQILKSVGTIEFKLAREEMAFKAVDKAYICPYTNRLLDSTFRSLSPYLAYNATKGQAQCREVEVPVSQVDLSKFGSDIERKREIRRWIERNSIVSNLRSENLWTDISDRVVEGARFYRAVEHSAQQPASKLDKYEALFKSGKINVMSCSTTMEMGVDIGGISVVAMNNVPPHPANYLQRAGRAGRRGETQALSFTICKDNPHERSVYSNPLWPFTTTIPAPYVTLNSDRILQRHINSLLLAYFLKEEIPTTETSVTSLSSGWFFIGGDNSEAPVDVMLKWMNSISINAIPDYLKLGMTEIISNSILAGVSQKQIISQSIQALEAIKERWMPGYLKLKAEYDSLSSVSDKDPFKRKLEHDLKSIGESYLLSELASKAYLPGYGFPTGIATFDHYSVSDYQRKKYVKKSGRVDNMARLRDRPGRDMAVAIREYAPGADVVLDGLVYRSAGIQLNKFSPDQDFSKPQKMMIEWRCHHCGHIGNASSIVFEGSCTECGSKLKQENIKEYIVPDGFSVDFYSSPSTDISMQSYVPVQEPWVTAGTELQPLFEPLLGSYRNSATGHVFNHSSGENGYGYAVCLRCGKAESMTIDNEFPASVKPSERHLRLQGKQGPEADAWCDGSDEQYAIKANVHLGATDQTDVFELYLKHPGEDAYIKHKSSDPLPWTLAIALRQSLADIHGINADEMGYTVKPETLPGCNYPVMTIVLFDKSGGGAGFASAAPRYIREMLLSAIKNLECVDECDSACQSCLMGYDTRFHTDLLNRHIAREYLQKIIPYLEMPAEAKIFGDDSVYCFESLTQEILSVASKGAGSIKLFTSGDYSDWHISASNLKEHCLNWRNVFNKVELVLPYTDLNSLSEVHKEDLYALMKLGTEISVTSTKNSGLVSKGGLLVQVETATQVISFGTNSESANLPTDQWWVLDNAYLVKTNALKAVATSDIEPGLLQPEKQEGDIEVELMIECDGSINDLGEKFWNQLVNQSKALKQSFENSLKLVSVNYSDPYISSPLSMMLLAEIIHSLRERLGEKWNNTSLSLETGRKPANNRAKGLYAEWETDQLKRDVIQEYFSQMDQEILVSLEDIRNLPHGRKLTLDWDDGSTITIRPDHGVGCWSVASSNSKWLDINASVDSQINTLYNMLPGLKVRYSKKHSTQIFIKKR